MKNNEHTISAFDLVPDHITTYILGFVGQQDLQRHVRFVDKRFYSCRNQALSTLECNLSNSEDCARDIEKRVRLFPNVSSLKVVDCWSQNVHWLPLLGGLLKLERISLKDLGLNRLGVNHLVGLGRKLKQIEFVHVDFKGLSCEELIWSFAHIQSLALTDCHCEELRESSVFCGGESSIRELFCEGMCISDNVLHSISLLENLESLNVSGSYNFSKVGVSCLGSCKRLEKLVLSVCRDVNDAICEALADLISLKTLSIFQSEISCTGLERIGKLSNLVVLDIGYLDGEFHQADLLRNLSRLHKLKVLNLCGVSTVNDDVITLVCSKMKSLVRLDISECQGITREGFQHVQSLKCLKDLSCGWNSKITNACLKFIPKSIEKLDLSYSSNVSDDGIKYLRECSNLRTLRLRYCNGVKNSSLGFVSQCKMITSLDIGFTRIDSKGLGQLQSLGNLCHLDLSGCIAGSTVLGLASLCNVRSLQCLVVSGNASVDDACLQAISFHPGLQELQIRQCKKISDFGLSELFRMKRLSTIDITGSGGKVTRKMIQKLRVSGVRVIMDLA